MLEGAVVAEEGLGQPSEHCWDLPLTLQGQSGGDKRGVERGPAGGGPLSAPSGHNWSPAEFNRYQWKSAMFVGPELSWKRV